MSLLHRSLVAQILAGLEPVVEGAVTALVPGGAAVAPLVHLGMEAAENVSDSVSAAPVAVAGTVVASPLPPAPAPAPAAAPAPDAPGKFYAPPPAAAPAAALSAADVVSAMLATLTALQAKL